MLEQLQMPSENLSQLGCGGGEFVIAFKNSDGNAYMFQERASNNFSREVRKILVGKKLFEILTDDLGRIHYENNKLVLTEIYIHNTHNTAMILLGKIAEAVIVRRCNEKESINQKWFSIARRKNARINTASKFQAVGTGLKKTKNTYPSLYNPSDPQRDIIWFNPNKKTIAHMKGSTQIDGREAGLQIKVSKEGWKYFLNDLYMSRYEVPVVYFDIGNDFNKVANKLIEYRQKNSQLIHIGEDLICAREVDPDAFQEILNYIDLVIALLQKKLRPEDLIEEAGKSSSSLRNAVAAAAFESEGFKTYIV